MDDVVIKVTRVSKQYRLFTSPRQRLLNFMLPWLKSTYTSHQALTEVSLQLRRGESLAVIGANGAGKSTLLKMLAGISHPSSGEIAIRGSVGAIVELGLGFHPDFTGRQNVRASLVMQGLSSAAASNLLDDINDFSELGAYFDRPVRTYSSGMQARLAFATATSIKPDTLIVDEVLSVGDAYFQGKSIRRIELLLAGGTSLLFVSHDLAAVKRLCNRALLLDGGAVAADGPVLKTLDQYNALMARTASRGSALNATQSLVRQQAWLPGSTRSGTGEVTIEKVEVRNDRGESVALIMSGATLCIHVSARVNAPVDELCVGISIRDRLGQTVYGTNTYHHSKLRRHLQRNATVSTRFNLTAHLGEGQYVLSVSAHRGAVHTEGNFDWLDNCLAFDVINATKPGFIGACNLSASVDIDDQAPSAARIASSNASPAK